MTIEQARLLAYTRILNGARAYSIARAPWNNDLTYEQQQRATETIFWDLMGRESIYHFSRMEREIDRGIANANIENAAQHLHDEWLRGKVQ